jgi:two-component system, chemotaxis family, chemotaxis protein CheY
MQVLIVDDAAAIRHQINRLLTDLGVEVVLEAGDITEAWLLLLQNPQISLVISDYHMPLGTGVDLLQKIRSEPKLAQMPVIMLTTEQERSKVLQAVKLGLQGYLFKPVQKHIIREKLQSLGMLATS